MKNIDWSKNRWDTVGENSILGVEPPRNRSPRTQTKSRPTPGIAQRQQFEQDNEAFMQDITESPSFEVPINESVSTPNTEESSKSSDTLGAALAMLGAVLNTSQSLAKTRNRNEQSEAEGKRLLDLAQGELYRLRQRMEGVPQVPVAFQPLKMRYEKPKWERDWGTNVWEGESEKEEKDIIRESSKQAGAIINPYSECKDKLTEKMLFDRLKEDTRIGILQYVTQKNNMPISNINHFEDVDNLLKSWKNDVRAKKYLAILNNWKNELLSDNQTENKILKNINQLSKPVDISQREHLTNLYNLKIAQRKEEELANILKAFKETDLDLYNYINNLKVNYKPNSNMKEGINMFLQIRIYVHDNTYKSSYGANAAAFTNYAPLKYNRKGIYNNKEIVLPLAPPPIPCEDHDSVKTAVYNTSTSYVPGVEINLFQAPNLDESLANEFGDLMFIMEYNEEKLKLPTQKLSDDNEYRKRMDTKYSDAVEESYKSRKDLSNSRTSYPLKLSEIKK